MKSQGFIQGYSDVIAKYYDLPVVKQASLSGSDTADRSIRALIIAAIGTNKYLKNDPAAQEKIINALTPEDTSIMATLPTDYTELTQGAFDKVDPADIASFVVRAEPQSTEQDLSSSTKAALLLGLGGLAAGGIYVANKD